jgi:hypothetical protein
MKLVKKIFSLGLLAAIPVVSLAITEIGVTSKANAVPFGAATVYKVTQSGISSVYLSGTANSKIEVDLGSTPKTTARVVGSCGEVKIAVPTSGSFAGLKVDGTSIDTASLPIQTLPTCISGAFSEARPANFKTPNGQVVVVGKTAGSAATIALPSDVTKNINVNSCGFGKITATETLPLTSFSIAGTSYTLASLPNAGQPPVCKVADGVSTIYTPSSWP